MNPLLRGFLALLVPLSACPAMAASRADPSLPRYIPVAVPPPTGMSCVLPDGTIRLAASAHAQRILKQFDELFARTHPGFRFAVTGGQIHPGSVHTLIPALAHGLTPFTCLGRDIYKAETESYRTLIGTQPLEIRIAYSAAGAADHATVAPSIGVYVNDENPIERLTVDEVARIFTIGSPGGDLTCWSQLGIGTEEWKRREIHTYGTPSYSAYGTYLERWHFGERPLRPGHEIPGHDADSREILRRVGSDAAGIGFAQISLKAPHVKMVALGAGARGPFCFGSDEDVAAGRYPFARPISFYLRLLPGRPLDPFVREYLRMVLSYEGQAIIAGSPDGYVPLRPDDAAKERAKLDAPAAPALGARTAAQPPADGSVRIVGDAATEPLLRALDARFESLHPNVRFDLQLAGTFTGIGALMLALTPFAPLARAPWPTPTDATGFREVYRTDPYGIRIGRMGYGPGGATWPPGVYVNRENPIRSIAAGEVARVFTAAQPGGDITSWSQLHAGGEWARRRIHVYGLRDDGTEGTVLRQAWMGGEMGRMSRGYSASPSYEPLATNEEVLAAVAHDPFGIGFASFADPSRIPATVRMLPIASAPQLPAASPTYENVRAGRYPYSTFVHLYVVRRANGQMDPLAVEYARFALSREGQAILAEDTLRRLGFVPLSDEEAARELAKVETHPPTPPTP
jgi:phosphate transport system substrate-binding protein